MERYGTHHARDAHDLFETLGHDLNVFSSAMQINTQYMHTLHFSLRLKERITQEEVFGPVLAVMKVTDFDEALNVANSTKFKLTGGVFSRKPSNPRSCSGLPLH